MPQKLEKNAVEFAKQAHKLLTTFAATNHPQTFMCCEYTHAPTRTACVVNLHNLWVRFCKNLLIHSALGGYRTTGGIVLRRAVNLPSENDVMLTLRVLQPFSVRSYWEPNWSIANDYINTCRLIGIANFTDVSAAIGSTGSPADSLRHSRNYFAHRNLSTSQKVITALSSHGATAPLKLDVLLMRPAAAGASLFELWVTDLTIIAFAACV